jgi:hypothetical protein
VYFNFDGGKKQNSWIVMSDPSSCPALTALSLLQISNEQDDRKRILEAAGTELDVFLETDRNVMNAGTIDTGHLENGTCPQIRHVDAFGRLTWCGVVIG